MLTSVFFMCSAPAAQRRNGAGRSRQQNAADMYRRALDVEGDARSPCRRHDAAQLDPLRATRS